VKISTKGTPKEQSVSGHPRSAWPSVLVRPLTPAAEHLRKRGVPGAKNTANDGKKQMRRLTVEWGHAPPAGARMLIKPLPNPVNEVLRKAAERAEAGQ
jgi:hypothetical protein